MRINDEKISAEMAASAAQFSQGSLEVLSLCDGMTLA